MRNYCCVVVAKVFMHAGWCWVYSYMELCTRFEKYYKFTCILLILCFCIISVECCRMAGHVCIWAKPIQRDIARSMRNCLHDCCKNVHACWVMLGVVIYTWDSVLDPRSVSSRMSCWFSVSGYAFRFLDSWLKVIELLDMSGCELS